MSLDFPDSDVRSWEAQAFAGGQAEKFKGCDHCGGFTWLDDTILKAMDDKAMVLLRKATTDIERMEAQQLSIAALEVRRVIERLITQGEAARENLKQQSLTLEGETDGK